MKVHRIGRRHFLMGASGFTLGLPILPSLIRESRAQDTARVPPRFLAVATHHGATWAQNAFPDASMLTDSQELFTGHTIGRGDLVPQMQGENAMLSPMFTAPSSVLTDAMIAKLNIMAGLDIMYYLDHHSGAFLGNFDARAFVFEGSQEGELIPTIDQVLAYSSKFYPTLDGVLTRSLHLNNSFSYGFTDPVSETGEIVAIPAAPSSLAAFNQIFVPDDDPQFEALRARREFVVDRVHQNYVALRDGTYGDAGRISRQDRARLDAHLERIFELENKITTQVSCGDIDEPTQDVDQYHEGISRTSGNVGAAIEAHSLYNDVIVAAIMCGTTRIATVHVSHMFHDVFTDFYDWHNEVEHLSESDPIAQTRMWESHRNVFEHVFLDLATKLDVEEASGFTYLDNSLMMLCPQFGCRTHWSDSIPIVTAGSAAGYLGTGNYVDYRNHNGPDLGSGGYRRPGISYNQFMGTILQAMGLDPGDYERNGIPGYGVATVGNDEYWPSQILGAAGNFLPFLQP